MHEGERGALHLAQRGRGGVQQPPTISVIVFAFSTEMLASLRCLWHSVRNQFCASSPLTRSERARSTATLLAWHERRTKRGLLHSTPLLRHHKYHPIKRLTEKNRERGSTRKEKEISGRKQALLSNVAVKEGQLPFEGSS